MNLGQINRDTLKQELIRFSSVNNLKFPEMQHGFNIQEEVMNSLRNNYHSTEFDTLKEALKNFESGQSQVKINYQLTANHLGKLLQELNGSQQDHNRQNKNRYQEPRNEISPEEYHRVMSQGLSETKEEWVMYRQKGEMMFLKRLSTLYSWMENNNLLGQFTDSEIKAMDREVRTMDFNQRSNENKRKKSNPFAEVYKTDFSESEFRKAAIVALTIDKG